MNFLLLELHDPTRPDPCRGLGEESSSSRTEARVCRQTGTAYRNTTALCSSITRKKTI